MKRRVAREIALQSLYQIEMNGVSAEDAISTALHEAENDNEAGLDIREDGHNATYIHDLVEGALGNKLKIDELLEVHLQGWVIGRLSRIDREVMRIAVYEMLYRSDVPPKVVVNEAIELAKHFGSEESGKFVNGVLGKIIKEIDTLKA